MKTLVYTAIFGNKDEAPILLKKKGVDLSDFRFLCVTDNPELKSEDYEVVLVKSEFSDVTKNARKIKVNGYGDMSEYDVAIWHDSSVRLHANQLAELTNSGNHEILSVFHHRRYCAYMEAIACIDQNKDSPIRITRQMFRYFNEGFPSNFKLHETTIMVINTDSFVGSKLQQTWWNEVANRSRRDQLSLAYARWKTNTEVALLADTSNSGFNNRFSTYIGHRHVRYEHIGFKLTLELKIIRVICKKLIYAMRRHR